MGLCQYLILHTELINQGVQLQAIAGIVEHWIADYFLASEPLVGSLLSFVARIGNSYWGAQVTSLLNPFPLSPLFKFLIHSLSFKLNQKWIYEIVDECSNGWI
jgi:hypothetical protein